MTRQMNDESQSTEFSLWLRKQPELDSKLGYVATNLDYIWMNYLENKYMLIEEKRYNTKVKMSQNILLQRIHANCYGDNSYYGLHIIIFENTSPEDGKIFVNNEEFSKEQLLLFLKFEYFGNYFNGISN